MRTHSDKLRREIPISGSLVTSLAASSEWLSHVLSLSVSKVVV